MRDILQRIDQAAETCTGSTEEKLSSKEEVLGIGSTTYQTGPK